VTDVVDLQVQAYEAIDELCSSLTAEEWTRPTECPGWSVQDNLSHITGTESMLLGRPAPEHDPGTKPWVRNPPGASNEIQVDYRRSWPPEKVLDEYREVTSERTTALRALSDDDLNAESWTPIGPGTVRDLIAVRIMDFWVHEQDIRRAINKPGGLDGPVAKHALGRHASALGFVVGKKAAAPDGTTVVFDITGPVGDTIAIGVEGKRANRLGEIPNKPDVTLTMDLETFNALCTGRWDPQKTLDEGKVTIDGDTDLGRRIVENQNFMI
jgi:uncharacterized protein (TIGR03083 family)